MSYKITDLGINPGSPKITLSKSAFTDKNRNKLKSKKFTDSFVIYFRS